MNRLPEPSRPDVCDACGLDRPLYRVHGGDEDPVHRCADCLRDALAGDLTRQLDDAHASLRTAEEVVVRQKALLETATEMIEDARRWAIAMWSSCGTPWASNLAPELPVPGWLPPDGLEPLYPGIEFRDGPTGRRAAAIGGPDVGEVVRALDEARAAEPDLPDDELLTVVEADTGVPRPKIRTALDFRRAWPRSA
jgi:hypothetical protein